MTDEMALLEELEADLAAVEEAMATLDRITADGAGHPNLSMEIESVVSAERFPGGEAVTEVDLTGEIPAGDGSAEVDVPPSDTQGWSDQSWSPDA